VRGQESCDLVRLIKKQPSGFVHGDLTPMIDMTFQLIAFFMVLLNFTDAQQNAEIHLPSSQLAKPPEQPFEEPRTIQLTRDGTILFSGHEVTVGPPLEHLLLIERQVLQRTTHKPPSAVTIVLRADADARTGDVQQVIKLCQATGFEKFSLRARQSDGR